MDFTLNSSCRNTNASTRVWLQIRKIAHILLFFLFFIFEHLFSVLCSILTKLNLSVKSIHCIQYEFFIFAIIRISFFLEADTAMFKADIHKADENAYINAVAE